MQKQLLNCKLSSLASLSPNHRVNKISACLALAICCTSLIGCGPKSDRLEISGEVMLDGEPLDKGTIRFTAKIDGKDLAAGVSIKNGEYLIPKEKGLPPGTYSLEINSPDKSGKMVPYLQGKTPTGLMVAVNRIPAEYNVSGNKTIEVDAATKNHFVFDIVSKP